ncbi:TonB-dependent receptor [bacterium]|nr:TonB-dependent receptor [bacterium]
MKRFQEIAPVIIFIVLGALTPLWSGTTGKIAGTVTDKETGEPLPGANVVVSGTSLGAAADINGQYTILQIPPGVYDVSVSVIGYARTTIQDVRVRIDQTARADFDIEIQEIEFGEITVVAQRNIVREDVATSVVAVTNQEIESLPVSSVSSVVDLQAGIESGMRIRGAGADESLFLVDGITLRDPRNNQPISSIALSSIKEISIERGGFNAEYGQVRSGIVNVVTQDGSKTAYHGNVEFKYSPPAKKHLGISPFDVNSNWLRPYFDDDVCWTGTRGEDFEDLNANQYWDEGEPFTDENGDGQWTGWDKYTQRQYAEFVGWNKISHDLLSDSDPSNDVSAYGAQQIFKYETRKRPDYTQPDYDIDAGFGGPLPFVSGKLGDLRFFSTYRRHREMLLVPLSRDDYVDYDWSMKLISDISPSMKLTVSSMIGKKYTMQQNWSYYYIRWPGEVAGQTSSLSELFGTGMFSVVDIGHKDFSAKLTHLLNPETFYEVTVEHFIRDYWGRPPRDRDLETLTEVVDGYFVDEAPYGYDNDDALGIQGMIFGGFTCKRRDNTKVSATTVKADMTSQVNFNNLVKTGAEFVYNELDFDYGEIANYARERYEQHVDYTAKPLRAALYVQDKLETNGFIMNAGLRLDYSNSNTDWWDVDPYDGTFYSAKYSEDNDYAMSKSSPQWQLSPRLGISHPITETSKLFFNYGHFKQMPSYETLFQTARATDGRMYTFGDPDLTLAKTISYELGYDHSLFNTYLVQMAAFYHDIFDKQDQTRYTAISGLVYQRTTSNDYQDIRGFELTLRKNTGRWWTFFGNYTYQVTTSGHFGRDQMYQNPSDQKRYDEATVNLYQNRPSPSPYARFNLAFNTPMDYGPEIAGFRALGGYTMNVLFTWRAGGYRTYNPLNASGITNNIQDTDYLNTVLRFSKTLHVNKFRIQAFVDIDNLFNHKRMSLANFGGKNDDNVLYWQSLHLPESEAYDNIPGNDRYGDYRQPGAAYQPMEGRKIIDYDNFIGEPGVIYYDFRYGTYMEYTDNVWAPVDKARINKILDDKAYIDMPNRDSFTFLSPRQIFFGLRVSFDFK